METTVGQVIINDMLPEDMRDYNRTWDKKTKGKVLTDLARRHPDQFKEVSHNLLRFGAKAVYETGGQSFGIEDIAPTQISRDFQRVMGQQLQDILARAYKRGKTSQDPEVQQEIADSAIPWMKKIDEGINEELGWENPFDRQAYGTGAQKPGTLRSIVGADVFYVDQNNKRVPIPVTHGYAQGLTPAEYFIQSFGTRKGMVDLQKATQDAGFLCAAKGTQVRMADMSVKQIEHIQEGDMVWGIEDDLDNPKGKPVKVTHVFDNGLRNCYKTIFAGGITFISTLRHKILANNGNEHNEVIPIGASKQLRAQTIQGETIPIKEQKCVGRLHTYDIEVDSPNHLFVLANGLIISNSKQLVQIAHRLVVTDKDDDTAFNPDMPTGYPVDTDDPDNEGSCLAEDIGGYKRNTLLTPKILGDLKNRGFDRILIRSVMVGGPANGGVYANDCGVRESGSLPNKGDFVGINAVQAISEPLTQGAISSKHSGGVAGADSGKAISGFKYVNQLIQVPKHFPGGAVHSELDGVVTKIEDAPQGGKYIYVNNEKHYVGKNNEQDIPITVKVGDRVEAGDTMTEGIPNPAMIVKYKGIGEGRRYFTQMFRDALNNAGTPIHRRNIEMLSRGLINYIKLTDEVGDYAPDDILPYSMIERDYKPREDSRVDNPESMEGYYLEKPILHYSIGTKLRPSVIKQLREFGIKRVVAHKDPPPFEPEMVRGMAHVSKDPDWTTRLLGAYNKDSLLEGARRGATSSAESTSYVPAITFGEGDFGHIGPLKQGSVKQADVINTPDITTSSTTSDVLTPNIAAIPNIETIPATPQKPSFLSQQAHNYVDQQLNKAINQGTNTATGAIHDAVGTYLHTQEGQDFLNKSNIPGIFSAIDEEAVPALNNLATSPICNPVIAGTLHWGLNSTPEERKTLPYSLGRIIQGQTTDPMYPHASPYSRSPVNSSSNNKVNNPTKTLYNKILWGVKRFTHPTTVVYDVDKLGPVLKDKLLQKYPVLGLLTNSGNQNETPEQYIRQGAQTLNAIRHGGEIASSLLSDIPGINLSEAVSDTLDYLSTGIPTGVAGNLYNATPIALYATPRYFTHAVTRFLAKEVPRASESLRSFLALEGIDVKQLKPIIDPRTGVVMFNPALAPLHQKLFSSGFMKKLFNTGVPAAFTGINYATDAYLGDELFRDIETQTNINGNSNYDAKRNLYTAPYDIWQQGQTRPEDGSVIVGKETFGNQEVGTHSYDPISILNLGNAWSNNSEYKKQRRYLDQMEREDPNNKKGIPYGAFYNKTFLPVYTENGDYVLAIPPRNRTWKEYGEDWKKWWNKEPITLRPDQKWTVPVDTEGNPVPARMPENKDDIFHPLLNLLGIASDRKTDVSDYGAQIKRINGMLSRRPMFPQLNQEWDSLIQRKNELTEQENSILKDIFTTEVDLASKTNIPAVNKLAQIANEWEQLSKDVDGLYMLEDYYQYKANPEIYEEVYSPLPWESYVTSKSEEERKRLPKGMIDDWEARTLPVRQKKFIRRAVEDAAMGWFGSQLFATKDPQKILKKVKQKLLELKEARKYNPNAPIIPFTDEDINNLTEKDVVDFIPVTISGPNVSPLIPYDLNPVTPPGGY